MLNSTTCPACQEPKSPRWKLCRECHEIYGWNRSDWPAWLRFLVNDTEREQYDDEREAEHCEASLCEVAEIVGKLAAELDPELL